MVTGMRGDRARSALSGGRFHDLRWVDETGSTNRDLAAEAARGAPEGVVLVADLQTAGRGRLDRSWVSPAGGSLLMSVLLRPRMAASDAHLLGTAMGVAAAEACADVAGVEPGLKWPNDLVVPGPGDRDRKLAGVLAESSLEGAALASVVVGLGLNVNWPTDWSSEGSPELADLAVALNQLAGRDIDREHLLVAVLERFDHAYGGLLDGDRRRAGAHATGSRPVRHPRARGPRRPGFRGRGRSRLRAHRRRRAGGRAVPGRRAAHDRRR